jgi:hypothetical protein
MPALAALMMGQSTPAKLRTAISSAISTMCRWGWGEKQRRPGRRDGQPAAAVCPAAQQSGGSRQGVRPPAVLTCRPAGGMLLGLAHDVFWPQAIAVSL